MAQETFRGETGTKAQDALMTCIRSSQFRLVNANAKCFELDLAAKALSLLLLLNFFPSLILHRCATVGQQIYVD